MARQIKAPTDRIVSLRLVATGDDNAGILPASAGRRKVRLAGGPIRSGEMGHHP